MTPRTTSLPSDMSVTVSASVPAWLAAWVTEVAQAAGLSRSRVIGEMILDSRRAASSHEGVCDEDPHDSALRHIADRYREPHRPGALAARSTIADPDASQLDPGLAGGQS